jgi:hypothetical protein
MFKTLLIAALLAVTVAFAPSSARANTGLTMSTGEFF